MAADELFRPTLLVGVGGTGSRIAERIMTTAVDTDRSLASKIGILCFDTDINTLNELKHVEKRSRIQFSQPERVATLLERMWPHVNTWCYGRQDAQMSQAILGMSLIEGAGQIRMLTRLALHDAFASDNLMARIEDEVSRLGRFAEDDSYSGAIHVMVVGSLAGATGSGSFAQVSLAVQQAARNRNVSATVRGLLLLPDIYARSGVLPATQIENVLANGYASLKELNAYNVFASMPERGASFTFDYAPGLNIREGEMPFAAITFIDYENSTGGSMGRGIASYLDMAARAGYLMIFSPLGANYGSVTINDVRQRLDALRSGSHNMYSGIGVSALQYPIQSVRKYLSRQLVLENLRGDWTRLDDAFRAQRQRYDQQVADGANPGEPPDIKVSYVRDLKQLASEEPRIPFFRRIWEKLNPEVEDEQTHERKVRPLHITYADALLDYSRKTFWADSEVADAKNRNSIDGSALTEASSILEVVQRCEAMLKTDFRRMEATLEGRPVDIYQNATISADDLAENQYAAHHFQAYMIKDGPHPVQVRAFLYMLRGELVDRLGQLDSADVRLKLFRLANVFRPDDEIQSTRNQPSQRDTPQVFEKAQEADGGGGVLGIFGGGKKKQFVSDYVGYYNASLQKMREYANTLVAAVGLLGLLEHLRGVALRGLVAGRLDLVVGAEHVGQPEQL
ncbi:MAG: tubulin-like doman-containing protein, partial [Pseudomonadota bacterium]